MHLRRTLGIGVIIVLVVVLVFAVIMGVHSTISDKPLVNLGAKKAACDLLDPITAYQLLGGGVYKTANAGAAKQSTKELKVTSCSYTQAQPIASKPIETASLTVKTPYSQAALGSNTKQFKPSIPATTQKVPGYGDGAYWNSAKGELHILKHNNWYILSYGSGKAAEHTLNQTKKLADTLDTRL